MIEAAIQPYLSLWVEVINQAAKDIATANRCLKRKRMPSKYTYTNHMRHKREAEVWLNSKDGIDVENSYISICDYVGKDPGKCRPGLLAGEPIGHRISGARGTHKISEGSDKPRKKMQLKFSPGKMHRTYRVVVSRGKAGGCEYCGKAIEKGEAYGYRSGTINGSGAACSAHIECARGDKSRKIVINYGAKGKV